jgi:hypothetical protein
LLRIDSKYIVILVLGTRLSGREFAGAIFLSPSWPGEDPAIQFRFSAALRDLDHRVSTLRVGPVMTEKNQFGPKNGIKLPTFFMPDSSVLGTRIPRVCQRQHHLAQRNSWMVVPSTTMTKK